MKNLVFFCVVALAVFSMSQPASSGEGAVIYKLNLGVSVSYTEKIGSVNKVRRAPIQVAADAKVVSRGEDWEYAVVDERYVTLRPKAWNEGFLVLDRLGKNILKASGSNIAFLPVTMENMDDVSVQYFENSQNYGVDFKNSFLVFEPRTGAVRLYANGLPILDADAWAVARTSAGLYDMRAKSWQRYKFFWRLDPVNEVVYFVMDGEFGAAGGKEQLASVRVQTMEQSGMLGNFPMWSTEEIGEKLYSFQKESHAPASRQNYAKQGPQVSEGEADVQERLTKYTGGRTLSGREWYEQGQQHLDAGRNGLAVIAFSAAIDAGEDSGDVYRQRGLALARSGGGYKDAEQDMLNAVKRDPRDATAYYYIGFIHLAQGNSAQAEEMFATALKIDPTSALATSGQGLIAARKGNHEKAVTLQSRAIEHDPEYAAAYSRRADELLLLGRGQEAMEDYLAALRRRVPGKDAAAQLRMLLGSDHSERSRRIFEDVIEERLFGGLEIWSWAAIGRNFGYEYGLAVYDDFLKTDPDDFGLWWGKSTLYESGGDLQGALDNAEVALRQNPGWTQFNGYINETNAKLAERQGRRSAPAQAPEQSVTNPFAKELAIAGTVPLSPEIEEEFKRARNVLENPSADASMNGWYGVGESRVEECGASDPCFAVRNGGKIFQERQFEMTPAGYLLVVAQAATERINADGSITGLPSIALWLRTGTSNRYYLAGHDVHWAGTQVGEWATIWGIKKFSEAVDGVKVKLTQAARAGLPHNGSATWYDDVGVYFFTTEVAAKAFVARHGGIRD